MKRKTFSFSAVAAFAAALLLAVAAIGQETPAPPQPAPGTAPQAPAQPVAAIPAVPNGSTEYMPLRYLDEQYVREFAKPLGVVVYQDPARQNVILYGPAKGIETVKEFITKLDVPPVPKKDVALAFYLVVAGKEPGDSAAKASPAVMEEIAKLLESTMGLTQFQLWDTVFVRGRDGGALEMSGFLPEIGGTEENNTGPGTFRLKVGRVEVMTADKEAPTIALDDLTGGVEMGFVSGMGANNRPQAISRLNTGLKADMNVRENRMEVVGKISISNKGDSAILVVNAHLLDD